MIVPLVLHQKFVVVSDFHSHEHLEIFFADGLPDLHSDIFAVAQKNWRAKGIESICLGGGRFSIIDNYAVFYSKSEKYHRFENEVVEKLSKEHPVFKDKGYKIICKAGHNDPWELIEMYK